MKVKHKSDIQKFPHSSPTTELFLTIPWKLSVLGLNTPEWFRSSQEGAREWAAQHALEPRNL